MMATGMDAEEEEAVGGLFAEEEEEEEVGDQTQSLTQQEGEQRAAANLDTTGAGDKKKRVIKNPQPKLDPERLMGPRGIHTLEDIFKDWQPRGRGREFDDLDIVMKKMEHWAHRLYPKLPFDDTLDIIANRLGKKKVVTTYVKKIRQGMVSKPARQEDEEGDGAMDEGERPVARYEGGEEEERDVFEELARGADTRTQSLVASQPTMASQQPRLQTTLNQDQMERMRRNRELAEKRKKEREEAARRSREQEEQEEDELVREQEMEAANQAGRVAAGCSVREQQDPADSATGLLQGGRRPAEEVTMAVSGSVSRNGGGGILAGGSDSSAPSAAEWGAAGLQGEEDEEEEKKGKTAAPVLDLDQMMQEMDSEEDEQQT